VKILRGRIGVAVSRAQFGLLLKQPVLIISRMGRFKMVFDR